MDTAAAADLWLCLQVATTFWSALPNGTFYPMFIVATLAAIIASQVWSCSSCRSRPQWHALLQCFPEIQTQVNRLLATAP